MLERAFRVLDVLASSGGPDMRLERVSELAALAPSSTHRLLVALKQADYVVQDTESGRYGIGYRPVRLASAALRRIDVRLTSLPHLIRLRDATGETVTLSVRAGLQRVYVHQVESMQTIRASVPVGEPLPLYAGAAGKVFTAFADPPVIAEVLRAALAATDRPPSWHAEAFQKEVERVRHADVAFAAGERIADLATVAAPIRDHSGATIAALGLSAPRSRFSNERMHALASEVRDTAIAISSELGYPGGRPGHAGSVAAKRTRTSTTRRARAG